MTTAILWPVFALVGLIFAVWVQIPLRRLAHIAANPPKRGDLSSGEAARRYFAPVDLAANNLANLFEMPVLFFALVPLLMLTRHGGTIEVVLAWAYVALRAVHSVIHTGANVVRVRFLVYIVSCAVLLAMWLGFAVDLAIGR
jgi:hypothetical protein